jgi:hypothetical protein
MPALVALDNWYEPVAHFGSVRTVSGDELKSKLLYTRSFYIKLVGK